MAYVCHICDKSYQRERCFRSHVAICEFKNRSKKERDEELTTIDDMPSKKDLFIQIVFLTKELEKVKTELEIVKKTQGVRKNRVSIISWLNDNYKPDITLEHMIREIQIEPQDFRKLQEHKTKTVYVDIIRRFISENTDKKLPICAFPQSVDTVYVYTKQDEMFSVTGKPDDKIMWTNISEVFIQTIISHIEQKMLEHFNEWENEMGEKIYDSEEVSEEYSVYVRHYRKSNKILFVKFQDL